MILQSKSKVARPVQSQALLALICEGDRLDTKLLAQCPFAYKYSICKQRGTVQEEKFGNGRCKALPCKASTEGIQIEDLYVIGISNCNNNIVCIFNLDIFLTHRF